jgi:hypothetical protein
LWRQAHLHLGFVAFWHFGLVGFELELQTAEQCGHTLVQVDVRMLYDDDVVPATAAAPPGVSMQVMN